MSCKSIDNGRRKDKKKTAKKDSGPFTGQSFVMETVKCVYCLIQSFFLKIPFCVRKDSFSSFENEKYVARVQTIQAAGFYEFISISSQ